MPKWGSLSERIRHRRIKVAVAAWAYENNHHPIMSDADYDALAALVDAERNIATGNHRLDRFFQRHFDPHTGLWIHFHPNTEALKSIYAKHFSVDKPHKTRHNSFRTSRSYSHAKTKVSHK